MATSTDHEADPGRWGEDDSDHFLDHGRYYVPDRERQTEIVGDVLGEPPAAGLLIDLCCGEGLLLEALLDRFPECRGLGLDGSARMLARAGERLARFADRVELRAFDLADPGWRDFREPPWAAVSSLAVHHLDGAAKRRLFADLHRALAPGGRLVLADLVLPAGPAGVRASGREWDRAVRERSLALDGDLRAFEHFERTRWNIFFEPLPDPVDHLDTLRDQLRWLAEAGFGEVDVHWLRAGHAAFGGVKAAGSRTTHHWKGDSE